MSRFGSSEWADALRNEINRSESYRQAAAEWGVDFNGNLLFVFEKDEELDRDHALMLRLSGGSCQQASFETDAEGMRHDAGFVMSARFGTWKDIISRKQLAATAILTGKIRVDGDKMKLLQHTEANLALMNCTTEVETSWD